MKSLLCLVLLALAGCAAGPRTTGEAAQVTADLVLVKTLRGFNDANAMSVDQFRYVYIVETSANSVIKVSPNGDSLREVSGFGADHYQFNGPSDIDAHLTNSVFISDRFNHRVEQYTKELTYVSTLYTRDNPDPSTRFGYPAAVTVDNAGNIYVADGENKRVLKARSDFSVERVIGGYSEAARPDAVLSNPVDLAIAGEEHLVVLDNGGTSLVEFDNLGNLLARRELSGRAKAICASNDTIFVLSSDEPSVQLILGTGLTPIAAWHIERNAADDSQAEDLAVRNGAIYFLTRKALYGCKLQSVPNLAH
ncbi:MAG: NHL repeat-containing protein [Candidatus Kapaibacterium sp.]